MTCTQCGYFPLESTAILSPQPVRPCSELYNAEDEEVSAITGTSDAAGYYCTQSQQFLRVAFVAQMMVGTKHSIR